MHAYMFFKEEVGGLHEKKTKLESCDTNRYELNLCI